jgi:membrane-bound inhibitor of C-type lysozyme
MLARRRASAGRTPEETMTSLAARRLAVAVLAASAVSSPALALNDNPHASAFVVLYQCGPNLWVPVGYPAPFARGTEPPARVGWNGETLLMAQVASGSGGRYVYKAADLEWRIKGREASMFRGSDGTLLATCREG